MRNELIWEEPGLIIRRLVRDPGEATPWHSDACRRFSVVVRGERLRIEFRDRGEPVLVDVHPGLVGWDDPDPRVHRAVNVGSGADEEVVTFHLAAPGTDPQPRHE